MIHHLTVCAGCGAEWYDDDCACRCREGDPNYEQWTSREVSDEREALIEALAVAASHWPAFHTTVSGAHCPCIEEGRFVSRRVLAAMAALPQSQREQIAVEVLGMTNELTDEALAIRSYFFVLDEKQ